MKTRNRKKFHIAFQLTAARRRLDINQVVAFFSLMFQLTAARRRLVVIIIPTVYALGVSTHSRPKAAGCLRRCPQIRSGCFNSQPPEGGWAYTAYALVEPLLFQLTAARRRLGFALA